MSTPQDPFATPSEGGATPPQPPSAPPPSGPAWGAPAPGAPSAPPPGAYGGGYGDGGYGAPAGSGFGGPGGAPRGTSDGLGIAALVLGLLGLVTSWLVVGGLLGLIAIVLGVLALGKVKRGEASSKGMPIAGIVLGVISLLVAILIVVVGAAVFDDVTNFSECIEEAAGDPTAEADCEREFEDSVGG